MNMVGRRAGGKGGLGMVVDSASGVPVYRWEGGSAAPAPSLAGTTTVQEGVPIATSTGRSHASAMPTLVSARGASSGSVHSSVLLASGSVTQMPRSMTIPGRQAMFRKDPSIASWADEIPNAGGPTTTVPERPASERTPFVRVTVNDTPSYRSLPTGYLEGAASMKLANHSLPKSRVLPVFQTSSCYSNSLSATPSMRIPQDAIHGRATQMEMFASPYYAPYGKRPASTGQITNRTPAVHPGLQAGHYLSSPFPTSPPFPTFPAFPAFPTFPVFPAVSRSCILVGYFLPTSSDTRNGH